MQNDYKFFKSYKNLNDDINNRFDIHTKESLSNLDLKVLEDDYINKKDIADKVQLSIGKNKTRVRN